MLKRSVQPCLLLTLQQGSSRYNGQRLAVVYYILAMFRSLFCLLHTTALLGAFEKLRLKFVSFVMSVRLSTRNNSTPTGRIFTKIDIWAFFETLSRLFKFL